MCITRDIISYKQSKFLNIKEQLVLNSSEYILFLLYMCALLINQKCKIHYISNAFLDDCWFSIYYKKSKFSLNINNREAIIVIFKGVIFRATAQSIYFSR